MENIDIQYSTFTKGQNGEIVDSGLVVEFLDSGLIVVFRSDSSNGIYKSAWDMFHAHVKEAYGTVLIGYSFNHDLAQYGKQISVHTQETNQTIVEAFDRVLPSPKVVRFYGAELTITPSSVHYTGGLGNAWVKACQLAKSLDKKIIFTGAY